MTLTMGKTDGIQVIRLQRNNRKPKGVEEVRQSISVSHYLGTVSGCEAVLLLHVNTISRPSVEIA